MDQSGKQYNMDHYAIRYPTNVEDIADFLVRAIGATTTMVLLFGARPDPLNRPEENPSRNTSLQFRWTFYEIRDMPDLCKDPWPVPCSHHPRLKPTHWRGCYYTPERLSPFNQGNRRNRGWRWARTFFVWRMVDELFEAIKLGLYCVG